MLSPNIGRTAWQQIGHHPANTLFVVELLSLNSYGSFRTYGAGRSRAENSQSTFERPLT